jgi:hypothetical protein
MKRPPETVAFLFVIERLRLRLSLFREGLINSKFRTAISQILCVLCAG